MTGVLTGHSSDGSSAGTLLPEEARSPTRAEIHNH